MDDDFVQELSKLNFKLTRQVGKTLSIATNWESSTRSYSALQGGILEYFLLNMQSRKLDLRISGVTLATIDLNDPDLPVKLSAPKADGSGTEIFIDGKATEER